MLTFGYPLFLFGVAALGVPVFLHLMNRAIPVRLVFPATRFVRKAHLPREGRRELQDIVLLLLRLLLLAAAVLVFARPEWRRSTPAADALAGSGKTVIIVDASASMQGWGGIEGARRRLGSMLDGPRTDSVGLVISANGVLKVLPPGGERAALAATVAELEAVNAAGNHLPALQTAAGLLAPGEGGTLVVVSDFQQTDWQIPGAPRLGSDVQLQLIDINPDRSENVGITGASVTPLADKAVRVIAEIRNFGDTPQTRRVDLSTAGKSFTREVTMSARQTRKTAFVVRAAESTYAELTMPRDEYAGDDSYRLWLGRPRAVNVLAVVPLQPEPGKAEELFFLKKALLAEDETSRVTFHLDTAEEDFFFALNLHDTAAVFLLGAAGYFREPELKVLEAYLRRGGVVVCTPGEAAVHQFHSLQVANLFHATFRGIAGEHRQSDELFGIGWVNPDSALGQAFVDAETTDLFLFPIRRYARLQVESDAQVLLRTVGGDPVLLERTLGTGRLFVAAFGFEPAWSDLPFAGSFLPLVRELLSSALPADAGVVRLECDQDIPVPRDLLGQEDVETKNAIAAASTAEPGVFLIGETPCEVNVSRRESVVDKADIPDLQARLTDTPGDRPAGAGPRLARAPTPESSRVVRLWPYCALAAAALLLAEMAAAGLMDRSELSGRKRA